MSVAKQGPAEDQKVENADLTGARDDLGEALLREPRGTGAHRPEGVHTVHLLRPRRTIRGLGRADRRPRQRGFKTRDAFRPFIEATARAQQDNLR